MMNSVPSPLRLEELLERLEDLFELRQQQQPSCCLRIAEAERREALDDGLVQGCELWWQYAHAQTHC